MDAKELGEKIKLLQKAVTGREPPQNVLSILELLKKKVVPTEELLRVRIRAPRTVSLTFSLAGLTLVFQATKAGVVVNRVKQNPDPNVSRVAGEIVSKWRKDVEKLKAKKATASSTGSSPPGRSTPTKAAPAAAKVTVPSDKRTWKTDSVDINRTDEDIRNSGIGLLYNGLAYLSDKCEWTKVRFLLGFETEA
jgi:transcription elongation factor S-II